MADFEGLINQALARQNAADPAVRDRIYQSSRNALVKMLAKKGISTEEGVRPHFDRLEASIASIEARYAPPPPAAAPQQEPQSEPVTEEAPTPPASEERPEKAAPTVDAPAAMPQPPADEPAPEAAQMEPAPNETSPSMLNAPPPVSRQEVAPPSTPQTVLPDTRQAPEEPPQPPVSSPQPEARNGSPADSSAGDRITGGFVPDPVVTPQRQEPVSDPEPLEPPTSPEPENRSSPAMGSEPDIIAELEALMPKAYEPEPMFPAPETAAKAPSGDEAVTSAPPAGAEPAPPAEPDAHFPTQPEPGIGEADANRPVEPYLGDVTGEPPTSSVSVDDLVADRDAPPVYKRKNPLLRRIWPITLAIAVVLIIFFLLYAYFEFMTADNPNGGSEIQSGAVGEAQTAEDGSVFITLLEPTDLSALVTAGRGTAELLTQRNRQMLRIQSVRQGVLTGSNADPILLEMEKGVLRQVTGKEVTVEIYAQSGESGAAQFAIECDFGGDSICGRKRFRVGAQPERIVFALDLTDGISEDARSFLAISTDITSAADTSGTGDALDIIYVRLRLPGDES